MSGLDREGYAIEPAGRGIVAGVGPRVFQQRDPVAPVTNL